MGNQRLERPAGQGGLWYLSRWLRVVKIMDWMDVLDENL